MEVLKEEKEMSSIVEKKRFKIGLRVVDLI